jgi:hypothetical protein
MQMPPLPPCGTSHKKLMTPKRIRRKLKNFEISKYQNRKPSKFTSRKTNTPLPLCESS